MSTYLFLVYGGCHVIGLNPVGFIAFSEFCLDPFCFFFCLDPLFFSLSLCLDPFCNFF